MYEISIPDSVQSPLLANFIPAYTNQIHHRQLNLLSVIERYFRDFHPPLAIFHIAPPWVFHVQFWLELGDQVIALVQLGYMPGKPGNYCERGSYN